MRYTIVIIVSFLLALPLPAAAAQWYLVMAEKSELYSAVAVHRLETTLIQNTVDQVAVWVRTDFLRPKGFKYPKQPRTKNGKLIKTGAYIWTKERYLVDCRLQQINVTYGSYMLAHENIEWASSKSRMMGVTPDSISEVVFKLVCANQRAKSTVDIQRSAKSLEKALLPDPQEQEHVRKEQNVPRIQI